MIKVKLRPEQGIKVKTTPAQSPEAKLKTVYLYDPDWIPEINKAVEEANESAEKAKTSAESAEASANSAAESARNADADADNASESAGLAAQEAQKAIDASTKATKEADAAAESAFQAQTSALAAAEYAKNASSDAENALESLEHVLASVAEAKTSELNAKDSETKAKESEQKATQEANASAESAYQSQQSALSAYEYASNAEADASNVRETLDLVLDAETAATKAAQTATEKAQQATDGANIAAQKAEISIEKADEASQFALECQTIKDSLGNVYKFKGSVNTYNDLPSQGNEVGDVYNVIDTDANYAWDGEKWDALGGIGDLSDYALKTEIPDIQINGTSIVKDGVSNIPSATTSVLGVVKTSPNQGISAFSQGDLCVISANTNEISAKTQAYKPIVPKTIDYAVKTSITTNTIDLTDEEKQEAQDWLGIPAVPTKTSELENDSGFITAEDMPEPDLTGYLDNKLSGQSNSVGILSRSALSSTDSGLVSIGSDSQAGGTGATAIGYSSYAAARGTAMGYDSNGTGSSSIAIGYKASATKSSTIAIGSETSSSSGASASSENAIAIGSNNVQASGSQAIALGKSATASSGQSIAIGSSATAKSYSACLAIGANATSSHNSAVAIGQYSNASGNYGVAVGAQAVASGGFSSAFGNSADATASQSVAIGAGAEATQAYAIQIGKGTNSTANTFQVGSYQVLDANGKIPVERLPDETTTVISDLQKSAMSYWSGTAEEYNSIEEKDSKTIYDISDDFENVDKTDVVIDYKNPTAEDNHWYRIYRSGWIEEGGIAQGTVSGGNAIFSITFLSKFTVLPSVTASYLAGQGTGTETITSLTLNGFTFEARSTGSNYQNNNKGLCWKACGFGG